MLRWLTDSRFITPLLRQNMVLFAGGLGAGVGGFVFHAIAARSLGPTGYGEVASLISTYSLAATPGVIASLAFARYTASVAAMSRDSHLGNAIYRVSLVIAGAGAMAAFVVFLFAPEIARFEHVDELAFDGEEVGSVVDLGSERCASGAPQVRPPCHEPHR